MRYKQFSIGFIILLVLHQTTLAEEDNAEITTKIEIDGEPAPVEENTFSGEGELGITNTSGNTENQNVIAKLGLKYQMLSWAHQANLEVIRSETQQEVTAKRSEIHFRSDYLLSKIDFLLGEFRYEDDHFTGYDYQSVLAAGYGRKLINTDRIKLGLTGALGIKQYQLLENDNDSERRGVAIFGLEYSHKIGAYSEFSQLLRLETTNDNTYSKSDSAFKVNIMENVALKLSLLITHNSDVLPDIKKTDTISAVTLVYGF